MSANPTRIARRGTSTLTIQVLRSNGIPVNPGTEIRLSSNIGVVDPVVHTDDDGVAHATLRGDGRVGEATVVAHSGNVDPVETVVAVGSLATSISLSVDPSTVPESGGVVQLIALVRDENGQPLPDASVNFRTEAGSLDSGGRFLTSNANGEVRDRLRLSAADVQAEADRVITVTVESGGEDGVISDTADIVVQGPPIASFSFTVNANRIVEFNDTSSGDPSGWHWDFGDGSTSNQQSPVYQYGADGDFIVTLTVTNPFGSSQASQLVHIGP
jgi:hypothetical protein